MSGHDGAPLLLLGSFATSVARYELRPFSPPLSRQVPLRTAALGGGWQAQMRPVAPVTALVELRTAALCSSGSAARQIHRPPPGRARAPCPRLPNPITPTLAQPRETRKRSRCRRRHRYATPPAPSSPPSCARPAPRLWMRPYCLPRWPPLTLARPTWPDALRLAHAQLPYVERLINLDDDLTSLV